MEFPGLPKGPVLGPLVLGGVLLKREDIAELKAAGVRDSKLLSPKRRGELVELIRRKARKYFVIEISPTKIDKWREKISLNEIEARAFAKIIDHLGPEVAYVDSASANGLGFERQIRKYMKVPTVRLVVEPKADKNYISVAAASIIAKVHRDHKITELCKCYGEIGSGYCSDVKTKKFLKRWMEGHTELPEFARKSWRLHWV